MLATLRHRTPPNLQNQARNSAKFFFAKKTFCEKNFVEKKIQIFFSKKKSVPGHPGVIARSKNTVIPTKKSGVTVRSTDTRSAPSRVHPAACRQCVQPCGREGQGPPLVVRLAPE
jgi:hypothetical protein